MRLWGYPANLNGHVTVFTRIYYFTAICRKMLSINLCFCYVIFLSL